MATEAKIVVKIDDAAARRKTDQAERAEKRAKDDQGRGGGGGGGGKRQGRGGSGGQGRGGTNVIPAGKRVMKGLVNIVALGVAARFFETQVGFLNQAKEGKGIVAEVVAEVGKFLPKLIADGIRELEGGIQAGASLAGSATDFARGQKLLGGKLDTKELGKFLKERAQLTALEIRVEKLKAAFGRGAVGAAAADAAEELKNKLLGSGSHG